jgi:hypothetical protein
MSWLGTADLTDEASPQRLVDAAVERYGRFNERPRPLPGAGSRPASVRS